MDRQSNHPSPNANANASPNLIGDANMPHSEKGQSAPPSSDDVDNNNQLNGDDGNAMANTTKASVSKKKKGTASTVKAPSKRARPGSTGAGGSKKAKAGGPKKAKTDAASKQPGAGSSVADDDGGDSSGSDNGPYCLCRGPDDHRFMIACDRCEDWFHGACIGMDKHTGENLVQKYICPNCTEGGRYMTRYKKMCSLPGCEDPARIYDATRPSIFCCPEHCQTWWEQLIADLPRTKGANDNLTQQEFMGLLDTQPSESEPDSSWKLGKPPFETPPNFWDSPASTSALTPEEQTFLTTSATTRYHLGEEIILCKKMLQLIDLALARREAAVSAGRGTAKDLCGYDYRLDHVGTTHQFALFLSSSPKVEAALKEGSLDPNPSPTSQGDGKEEEEGEEDPLTAGMCARKKCKAHNGWSAILTKAVKHDMKELAAQAKEKLDAEQRVRDGAAGRFRRRLKERNGVVVVGGSGSGGGVAKSERMDVD